MEAKCRIDFFTKANQKDHSLTLGLPKCDGAYRMQSPGYGLISAGCTACWFRTWALRFRVCVISMDRAKTHTKDSGRTTKPAFECDFLLFSRTRGKDKHYSREIRDGAKQGFPKSCLRTCRGTVRGGTAKTLYFPLMCNDTWMGRCAT